MLKKYELTPETKNKMIRILKMKSELKSLETEVELEKKALKSHMLAIGLGESFFYQTEEDEFDVRLKKGSTRKKVDYKKLKNDFPQIYKAVITEYETSPALMITLSKESSIPKEFQESASDRVAEENLRKRLLS